MRLVLAALVLAGALSAATVSFAPERASTPVAPRVVAPSQTAPARPMPDAAARLSLRRIAVIAAGQARTLRRSVRRCARPRSPGRCSFMALARAAAGARLNSFILRQIVLRLPPGGCRGFAGRLGGLMGALFYVAEEGVRGITTAGAIRAAARAASRVDGAVIAFARRAPPRRCGASPVRA
jgi:hypothetical protein